MLKIRTLAEQMDDELEDACEYIEDAFEVKESYPQLANTYYELANQKVAYAEKLHSAAVDVITKLKNSTDKKIPEQMEALWDFEHKVYIGKMEKVKFKISMYNKY